jgi:hypothetical protein
MAMPLILKIFSRETGHLDVHMQKVYGKCKKIYFLEKYIFCTTISKIRDYDCFKAKKIKGSRNYTGEQDENFK